MTYTAPKFDQSQYFTCLTCPNYYKFKDKVNRGSCTAFGKVAYDDWTSTNDCRLALETESTKYLQSFEQPENIPHSEFEEGQLVKVIDREENHTEWRQKNYQTLPQLAGANPKEEYLDEVDLHYADLRGSYFKDKSLRSSKFQGADLGKANFENTDLRNADFEGANLKGINLTKADLTNANLMGADLSEAILVNAILDKANLFKANLEKANLTSADLRNANLNRANLEKAVLKYCLVYGVSPWDIKIKNTIQEKLNICYCEFPSIY